MYVFLCLFTTYVCTFQLNKHELNLATCSLPICLIIMTVLIQPINGVNLSS